MSDEKKEDAVESDEIPENLKADSDETESVETEPPPNQVGDFELLRKLGSGGMGDVFLAKQTSLNRQVALKVMRSDLVEDGNLLERFKTEATAAAHLNHPNIVQVYMIGEDQGFHYIAQEYVDGWNLREHLLKKGTISSALALRIIRQVASALKKAGEVGIVHRDIKPENIMITRKGVVKVADFGLARLSMGEDNKNLTQVGMTMGTPSYMSPEQVHGKKVDTRSDIYSLGVTCYHMLAGRPPFQGETALAIVVQHVNDDPPLLEEQRNDIPKALCKMIHRMMEKDPDDRYPDALALAADAKKLIVATQKGKEDEVELTELKNQSEVEKKKTWDWKNLLNLKSFLLYAIPTLLVFAGLGWLTRPGDPLLSEVPETTAVSKLNNVDEQFQYAEKHEYDEEAWQAVIDNFNPDLYKVKMAKANLARVLLQKGEYEEALKLFQELKSYKTENEIKAIGMAGEAIVKSQNNDYFGSNLMIKGDLKPLSEFLDARWLEMIRDAYKFNQSNLPDKKISQDILNHYQNPEELESLN